MALRSHWLDITIAYYIRVNQFCTEALMKEMKRSTWNLVQPNLRNITSASLFTANHPSGWVPPRSRWLTAWSSFFCVLWSDHPATAAPGACARSYPSWVGGTTASTGGPSSCAPQQPEWGGAGGATGGHTALPPPSPTHPSPPVQPIWLQVISQKYRLYRLSYSSAPFFNTLHQ